MSQRNVKSVIAYEHQPMRIPVSTLATGGKGLFGYADHTFGFFSRRSSTFFLVVSLHAVLLYGFMTAISHIHTSVPPDPLLNQPLPESRPHKLPPPLPLPQFRDVNLIVPKLDTNIRYEPDPDSKVTTEVVQEPLQPPLPPPLMPHVPKRVEGGPGTGFPNPDDFYPEPARRLEEQGIATVQVCVDAKGRLLANPTTLQGTGSARLDEGALKLARAGSGHYRATTEDGQPVNSCYALRIRFHLKN